MAAIQGTAVMAAIQGTAVMAVIPVTDIPNLALVRQEWSKLIVYRPFKIRLIV
jgi:hypothetical protein